MIYVLIGISLLFFVMGFILTEKNAKSLLSGYNTMSAEEREQFNLSAYISFFRKFHFFLGASTLLLALLFYYAFGEIAVGIFIGVYPILAYIYFIWNSRSYSKKGKQSTVALTVLVATLLFVVGLFAWGMRDNQLIVSDGYIRIGGAYGEEIPGPQIASITLGTPLPQIGFKTNGFALGPIKKGYFKTKEGKVVKLLVNTEANTAILIETKAGKKVYFSDEKDIIEALSQELNVKYSELVEP